MNLKNNLSLIINDEMRYVMVDNRFNKNGFDGLYKALKDSESYHVQHADNSELIIQLKSKMKDIDNDDLWPLYHAVTDNEDGLFDANEILAMLDGDEK